MIRSIGLDIVEIGRVRKNIDRFGTRFVRRVLGDREAPVFHRRRDAVAFLAGRLAAKEAVIKGLGHFVPSRPALRAIEIVNDDSGAPHLVLPAGVQEKLGGATCLLSLTHEKTYAAAVAIFQEG